MTNIKVFIFGGNKNIFFTIGNLPFFLREKEYLLFLFLMFVLEESGLLLLAV